MLWSSTASITNPNFIRPTTMTMRRRRRIWLRILQRSRSFRYCCFCCGNKQEGKWWMRKGYPSSPISFYIFHSMDCSQEFNVYWEKINETSRKLHPHTDTYDVLLSYIPKVQQGPRRPVTFKNNFTKILQLIQGIFDPIQDHHPVSLSPEIPEKRFSQLVLC